MQIMMHYCLIALNQLESLNIANNTISSLGVVSYLASLKTLVAFGNEITDLSALANLNLLEWISLASNQVGDLTPLVTNSGVGSGDSIILIQNSVLNCQSQEANLQSLRGRGAVVHSDCP